MSIQETEDTLADAKRQGQAQFESVREMVAALDAANAGAWEAVPTADGNFDDANEAARQAIEQDALSVQVRSGWYTPGATPAQTPPEEYEILLCTGGPACRIIGQLDEHCEPSTAQMQVQDWFQPWTDFYPKGENTEETLLSYARVFWYGE